MQKFTPLLSLILLVSTLSAQPEHATFDSGGKLTSLIHRGEAVSIRAGWRAWLEGDLEVDLQPHDQQSPISRSGLERRWTGTSRLPNGRTMEFETEWTPGADASAFRATLTHSPEGWHSLVVDSVDFVIDVPRSRFVGGRVFPGERSLDPVRNADGILLDATTDQVRLVDPTGNWTLTLNLTAPRRVSVTDVWKVGEWDRDERYYRIRIPVLQGLWEDGVEHSVAGSLSIRGVPAPAPARLSVDTGKGLYPFYGYGGNFCWGWDNGPEVTNFMIETLDLAWSRSELKLVPWDLERPNPGRELQEDFERIRRIQGMGVPWIISAWRVPERFYKDPNRSPPGTFRRELNPAMWPELLDLIGSYLLHLKEHYGAEPDLISFNEPDLGVYVAHTAETHRDAIKHIGAHLRHLGLKTLYLLGDTANPRDQHQYLLPTIHDPEAMQYVGAISFHSWFGATPEQYRAWAEIARWIEKPLLIGEAGYDPGSYRNRNYDSYAYGLVETRENMRILRHAQPAASLFWQFTEDYGLARREPSGEVTPTGRYWLMKHFTNLTPQNSHAVATDSDQEDVLIAAFTKDGSHIVHILNLGAEREASLAGLQEGSWSRVVTTELEGFADGEAILSEGDRVQLTLPARSLNTLRMDR